MTEPLTQATMPGPGTPARPSRRRRRRTVAAIAVVIVLAAGISGALVWLRGSIGGLPLRPHCTATALGQSTELDPEQAGNAATIAAVAVARSLPARAATIGIATAMQESKLYNVGYGDRDSIGLFQQRPSQGWGTVAQIRDPVYASNAFYDVLVKIEGYASQPITKVAQKVQRSAFPAAYKDHETAARIFASALSGYSPAALSCVLRAPSGLARETADASGLTARASTVARAAAAELGPTASAAPQAGGTGGAGGAGGSSGVDGTAVRFAVTGKDSARLGWALAQWAVARADGLRIVAVEVAGRQWRRADVGAGWTTLPTPTPASTPTSTASTVVVVRVAPGT